MKLAPLSQLPISAIDGALLINKEGTEYVVTNLKIKVDSDYKLVIVAEIYHRSDPKRFMYIDFDKLNDWECQFVAI